MQVYYASEEFGLDSVVTAGGYFLMANIFLKQEKTDITISLYLEVHQQLLHLPSIIFPIHTPYFRVFVGCQYVACAPV